LEVRKTKLSVESTIAALFVAVDRDANVLGNKIRLSALGSHALSESFPYPKAPFESTPHHHFQMTSIPSKALNLRGTSITNPDHFLKGASAQLSLQGSSSNPLNACIREDFPVPDGACLFQSMLAIIMNGCQW
jgi:hypothetical protein